MAKVVKDLIASSSRAMSKATVFPTLEVASEFQPDIVLCDIGMRGMVGYEVALIVLSGYGTE